MDFNSAKIKSDAVLSEDRVYRYALWRIWNEDRPLVMFVGLNPSTADETNDDPTLRRCMGFAESWGYGGVIMANIFAYRATDPKIMKQTEAPIGPENDEWLRKLSQEAGLVIGAWGNHGAFKQRGSDVADMLPNLHYLKMNKSGHPAHPLYLQANLKPIPMKTTGER